MKREDKRIRRSRKALSEALIALTIEKGYGPVTIQEITDRAGVGYRTFFRHYSDKDALLQDVLQSTVTELRQMIDLPDATSGKSYTPLPVENGRIIFESIAGNPDLYRVLLSSGSAALEPVMAYAYREALNAMSQVSDPPVPIPILAKNTVATTFSLVQWWLENDMPYSPEEMAVYLAQLVTVPTHI